MTIVDSFLYNGRRIKIRFRIEVKKCFEQKIEADLVGIVGQTEKSVGPRCLGPIWLNITIKRNMKNKQVMKATKQAGNGPSRRHI